MMGVGAKRALGLYRSCAPRQRRAGKQFVLLVYPGENHHVRRKPNEIDYHRRILEWFDHYLRGAEAPKWITEGVPYLEQQKEKKD